MNPHILSGFLAHSVLNHGVHKRCVRDFIASGESRVYFPEDNAVLMRIGIAIVEQAKHFGVAQSGELSRSSKS